VIEHKRGNVLKEQTEALVNTVNCVGVMGRGVALQFKNAFPENFKAYAEACKQEKVKPGCLFVYETGRMMPPRYIINFPTKRHWRGKSRMEDIESGLRSLVEVIRCHNIRSIAIPPLGSGLGGLNWQQVKSHIEAAVKPLTEVQVIIYEPMGAAMAPMRKICAMCCVLLRAISLMVTLTVAMRRTTNSSWCRVQLRTPALVWNSTQKHALGLRRCRNWLRGLSLLLA